MVQLSLLVICHNFQAYVKSIIFPHSPGPSLKYVLHQTLRLMRTLRLLFNIHLILISSRVGGKLVHRPFSQFLRASKRIFFVYRCPSLCCFRNEILIAPTLMILIFLSILIFCCLFKESFSIHIRK